MNRFLRTSKSWWIQARHKATASNGHAHFRRTPNLEVPIKDVRNIGIIAHIDAGKTTVTERLLYLAGATTYMGDVDSGTTLTDYMELERERGITIQSAAVTLFWYQNRINLIDTPGHVDFQLEVERCARVLDGAVTVLDGSAGVQAQTLTVWRQASKFHLPSVFYVNKMDKPGADFQASLESIESRLQMQGVPVCVPYYEDGRLTKIVDLVRKEELDCVSEKADWIAVEEKSGVFDAFMEGREDLISALADVDDNFANHLLAADSMQVENDHLLAVLREATLQRKLSPVACGSALRSPNSVRPVLDTVVQYLPSPDQRNAALNTIFGDDLCGLVFKVGHDKRQGRLSYVRVYTGAIKNNSSVYNANKSSIESGVRVFIPHSDELQSTDKVGAGNIAVVTGLKHTVTGDTLIKNEHHGKESAKRRAEIVHIEKYQRHHGTHQPGHVDVTREVELGIAESTAEPENDLSVDTPEGHSSRVILAGIEAPDPVYFCSIEPPTAGAVQQFEKALEELVIEDPSIRVRQDSECGQTILEGMGELHIEVVKDRLQRDYGLNVFLGPLQVGYREVIDRKLTHTATVEDTFGDQKWAQSCSLTFEIEPTETDTKFKKVNVELDNDCAVGFIRPAWVKAINDGCKNALHNGPVFGFPVCNVSITLRKYLSSGGKLNAALLTACASQCLTEAFTNAGAHLMEPVMNVEITVTDAADRGISPVLQELGKRRAEILGVEGDSESGNAVTVKARMPLAESTGMAGAIRTATSGLGTIHMQFASYEHVSEQDQASIVSKMSAGRR